MYVVMRNGLYYDGKMFVDTLAKAKRYANYEEARGCTRTADAVIGVQVYRICFETKHGRRYYVYDSKTTADWREAKQFESVLNAITTARISDREYNILEVSGPTGNISCEM